MNVNQTMVTQVQTRRGEDVFVPGGQVAMDEAARGQVDHSGGDLAAHAGQFQRSEPAVRVAAPLLGRRRRRRRRRTAGHHVVGRRVGAQVAAQVAARFDFPTTNVSISSTWLVFFFLWFFSTAPDWLFVVGPPTNQTSSFQVSSTPRNDCGFRVFQTYNCTLVERWHQYDSRKKSIGAPINRLCSCRSGKIVSEIFFY